VCARHDSERAGVRAPAQGDRGAEGEEKDRGVTAKWGLEEAQPKSAGRPVCVRTHGRANVDPIRDYVIRMYDGVGGEGSRGPSLF
jgi:hypothetical protein